MKEPGSGPSASEAREETSAADASGLRILPREAELELERARRDLEQSVKDRASLEDRLAAALKALEFVREHSSPGDVGQVSDHAVATKGSPPPLPVVESAGTSPPLPIESANRRSSPPPLPVKEDANVSTASSDASPPPETTPAEQPPAHDATLAEQPPAHDATLAEAAASPPLETPPLPELPAPSSGPPPLPVSAPVSNEPATAPERRSPPAERTEWDFAFDDAEARRDPAMITRISLSPVFPTRDSRPPPSRFANRSREISELEVAFIEDCYFTANALSLEPDGFFVATYRYMPVGTRVQLSIVLPTNEHVEIAGEIAFVHRGKGDASRPGLDVKILSMADSARALVQRYCAERVPHFFDFS